MEIRVSYGKTHQIASLPQPYTAEWIQPRDTAAAPDAFAVVENALQHPIGEVTLAQFRGVKSAAIAINDKTRPVPHDQLLPPLLAQLEDLGLPPEAITLVIATGTHPVMLPEEYTHILPQDIINRYPIVCHDAYDDSTLVYLGQTLRDTPVFINKAYMAAQLRLVVGNIEPHQFMGFSGGVKSAAIGLAGKATINHNHAMMMDAQAQLGVYETNPARQDVEDIGRMIGIHFAHNALLNGKKQIVDVLSGDPVAVMTAALDRVREIYQVPVSSAFDLLIVSPGGHPKDINVYQAQKALGHAALVMKDGGTVILCAACPEGTGSKAYEQWITDGTKHTHDDVFTHFQQEGFKVGPHKAYQISRDASRIRVMLISDMPAPFVSQLLLYPQPDLQTALDAALLHLPAEAHIGVMPSANNTIPML
ncbi:MAG: nickel-dependent lactate racemase [Anaerolineae bacterium]